MARSSYIYVAVAARTGIPVLACTVKREFVERIQDKEWTDATHYFIRLKDNVIHSGDVVSRLELDLGG